MKLYVCAVRDSALQAFARPIFVPSVGVAMRSFMDEVNRAEKENALHAHPEDFELHLLALYDEELGKFEETERRCLVRAKEVKKE